MVDGSHDNVPHPLRRDWLPEATPPEGAPEWDARVRRIMAAAGPGLRRLAGRRSAPEVTWWSVMGRWWRPAGVLAAASTAVLLLVGRPTALPEPPPGSIPLGLIASEGDPVTLWGALGVQVDPVLALIALGEQRDVTGPSAPSMPREEEDR